MANFDYPSISVGNKSNEENMQSTRAWAHDVVDMLNIYIDKLEARIASLEEEVNELKGDN